MRPEDFLTHSLRDQRIAEVLHAALKGVDPAILVQESLKGLTLPRHSRCFLLGLGKASESMTRAAAEGLGAIDGALIITKRRAFEADPRFTVLEGGHPVPDARSLLAGTAALEFVSRLRKDDLLICLISGGGSALACAPVDGISLQDLQGLSSAALASGARIDQVNILRRQLDRIKGGGLSTATRASVLSLILSDVIGDPPESIASGPTVDNPTGPRDGAEVLALFHMEVPTSVKRALRRPKPVRRGAGPNRVTNVIIGNCSLAAEAARREALRQGFEAELIDTQLQGEAREIGRELGHRLLDRSLRNGRPFMLIAAGETTVTLQRHGLGGRNQELALSAVDALQGAPDCVLVAFATDGNDGPTDAAGAVVTGETAARAYAMGLRSLESLAMHDAYPFFLALGDLLKPGYTGTNVNDLILLCGL